ncbi:MAG: cytochrome P460 family protein [Verrucomicrobiota bacterium]
MNRLNLFFAAAAMLLSGCMHTSKPAPPLSKSSVQFPAGYEQTFANYLSLDRVQNPDQIIRLFANDTAMQGPGDDGKLPFGSVLVGEVYKAKKDQEGKVLVSDLGRRLRGDLALIAVMERGEGFGQDHPPELRNGHWEFAAFKPDGTVAGKDLNACRACHAPLVEKNHIFSYEHLIRLNEPVAGSR